MQGVEGNAADVVRIENSDLRVASIEQKPIVPVGDGTHARGDAVRLIVVVSAECVLESRGRIGGEPRNG
jgi:hypothetical protein